jgi:hypothetical protein
MAKVTGSDARQMLASSVGLDDLSGAELLNLIRQDATEQYKSIVPPADNSNIGEVGKGLEKMSVIQNEFINTLVERISLVIVKKKSLNNPLKKFKKGMMPLGHTIEEIFVDILKSKKYNADESEEKVFAREIPDTKVYFHHRNRQEFYKQTIQEDSLRGAFVSWSTFDNFLARIINAVYNSAEVDEYLYMMKLVNTAITTGDMKAFEVEQVGTDKHADANSLLEMMRTIHSRLTLPMGSRQFNKAGVHTVTDESDVHIFMLPETQAQIDVNALASAYNMDKATFIGNRTLIDGFEDDSVLAVIIDKNWFMVYDQMQKMTNIYNSEGLYWNYTYHVWQVMSYSLLENAVVIKKKPVVTPTTVEVTPKTADVKQGATEQFSAEVK